MNYVMSDIHGQYTAYLRMLEKIQLSDGDTLYILGDAIDRGPDSIYLLLDILTDKRVVFLVGNHEDLMIRAALDSNQIPTWMQNGGKRTLDQAHEMHVSTGDLCMEIYQNAFLVIPDLIVGGKHFYLAHATHLERVLPGPLMYKEATLFETDYVLWDREMSNTYEIDANKTKLHDLYAAYNKTTLIIGHTPVRHCNYGKMTANGKCRISRYGGHVINIDCGCSSNNTLGCLRLEDMKEFYVNI